MQCCLTVHFVVNFVMFLACVIVGTNILEGSYRGVDMLYSRVRENAVGVMADIYAFVVAVQSNFEMYSVVFCWIKNIHLLYICKVCLMEKKLLKILYNIHCYQFTYKSNMQNCGKFWLMGSMLEKERRWKLVLFLDDNDLHWVGM